MVIFEAFFFLSFLLFIYFSSKYQDDPIQGCKCDKADKADYHGYEIKPLDFVIQVHFILIWYLVLTIALFSNFFQVQNKAIFKQRKQDRKLSSKHPYFNVAESHVFCCIHRVVNVSRDEVKSHNHSHSTWNLKVIL